jgi:hypothetical protein
METPHAVLSLEAIVSTTVQKVWVKLGYVVLSACCNPHVCGRGEFLVELKRKIAKRKDEV